MPQGSISSSDDAVGVGVVNYQVPVVETKAEVLDNCKRIAGFIEGMKRGYPGLDLIVFPEYTTQGFHPTKWSDLTTTIGGDEVPRHARKTACTEFSRSPAKSIQMDSILTTH